MNDLKAYIHFGSGVGPFQTVSARAKDDATIAKPVRRGSLTSWPTRVSFSGKWYRVWCDGSAKFALIHGERVRITIER